MYTEPDAIRNTVRRGLHGHTHDMSVGIGGLTDPDYGTVHGGYVYAGFRFNFNGAKKYNGLSTLIGKPTVDELHHLLGGHCGSRRRLESNRRLDWNRAERIQEPQLIFIRKR